MTDEQKYNMTLGALPGFLTSVIRSGETLSDTDLMGIRALVEQHQEQYDALKTDAQLLLIESDAKTAALLQIVRRRAGNPAFEWMRQIALRALSEKDHQQKQDWVDALAPADGAS